jgi:ribosome-binding protein aMBF1 (putative translation factor)
LYGLVVRSLEQQLMLTRERLNEHLHPGRSSLTKRRRAQPRIVLVVGEEPRPKESRGDWPSRVRAYRQSRGLSQSQLATELRVLRGAVAHWEAGRVVPPECVRKILQQ